MKIEFYIPKDEVVPTSLRLIIDEKYKVMYHKLDNEFAYDFNIFGLPENDTPLADEIINKLIKVLCNQSYDFGAEWVEEKRELLNTMNYCNTSTYEYRVYFKIKDSY